MPQPHPVHPESRRSALHLLRRSWPFIAPFRGQLAGLAFLLLLSIPLNLLTPLPLTMAVDSVIGTRPLPPLLQAWLPSAVQSQPAMLMVFVAAASIGIALCAQLQGMAVWMLSSYTGERLIYAFRGRLFEHLQRISLSYHDLQGPSDSVYRIQHDAASVKQIPIDALLPFLRASCMLVGLAVLMILIDPAFALVGLSMLPLLFWLTHHCGKRLRARWAEVKKTETATLACAQEVLGASRLVKAFGREDYEQRRFLSHAFEWVTQHNALAAIGSGFDLKFGMTVAIGTACALVIGVGHVKEGRLSLGDLLLLMAYMAQLSGPLDTAAKKIAELQSHLVGFGRALTLLEIPPVITERPRCLPLDRAKGQVTFRDVAFGYGSSAPVLRDVSFVIPAAAKIGVVGPTGSGKSTLVNLLTRFYDPDFGAVLLDGFDLRDYRLADLRAQFAIVPQDPQLFATTIAENIRYGNPYATQAQVEAAAVAARADGFIRTLPLGYDSPVGARGARLSGGERQRIALARAFLRNAPIVILDEPTSALDQATEAELVEAVNRLTAGRTTFIIAHRTHTLRDCDFQLVLDEGRVRMELPGRVRTAPSSVELTPA